MPKRKDSLEDICKRFNAMAWHDSKLIGLHVSPSKGSEQEVCFDIRLRTKDRSEHWDWKDAKLTIKDCRIIKVDLDLLAKHLCANDIANAFCGRKSGFKEQIERELVNHFDLQHEANPLAEFLHFRILLIHPGGEINVLARDFELIIKSEKRDA